MEKADIRLYSWVIRGSQRIKIIKALDEPKTPTEIQKESNIKFSNLSDNLRLMRKKKLVVCLTPTKTGRLYQLTVNGIFIRDKLLKKSI